MEGKKNVKICLAVILAVFIIGGITYRIVHGNMVHKKNSHGDKDSETVVDSSGSNEEQETGKESLKEESHIVPARGGMPTKGDVKVLVVKVGFEDYPLDSDDEMETVYTDEELFAIFNGTEDGLQDSNQNGESLHSYYATSSYGLLNIHCDEIYEYNAKGSREEYGSDSFYDEDGANQLIDEVLSGLDDEIDYHEYDSDGDGWIDAVYLNFAGPTGDWSSTWWTHANENTDSKSYDGVQYHAYSFIHRYGDRESDIGVLIHETGHLLGMPDYYAYGMNQSNNIGTFDIMTAGDEIQQHNGDHNGFSKWSYGWLEEEDIQFVDGSMGETVVKLSNIDSEKKGGKKIAVIAPEHAKENGIFSQYFLVEYDAGENLTKTVFDNYGLEPGFRIFYVNAVLNEEGTDYIKDDNYQIKDRLIYDVNEIRVDGYVEGYDTFYREGDAFTIDSAPDSKFYSGKIGKDTGICITDFVTGENPSFKVTFIDTDDIKINNEIHWSGETTNCSNTLELELKSDKVIDFLDDQMIVSKSPYLLDDEGNQYQLRVVDDEYDWHKFTFIYDPFVPLLKSNTQYTLVMPKNLFIVADGVYTDEMRIPVKTGELMDFEMAEYSPAGYDMTKTNLVPLSEHSYGRMEFSDHKIKDTIKAKIREMDLAGNTLSEHEVSLPIVESGKEELLTTLYFESELLKLRDGNLVLSMRYHEQTVFYVFTPSGQLLAEPQVVFDHVSSIVVGNIIKGYSVDDFGSPAGNTVYTIDFEREPEQMNPDYEIVDVYPFDENSYIIKIYMGEEQTDDILLLMNGNDEVMKEITVSRGFDDLINENGNIRFLSINEWDDTVIDSVLLDLDGNILEEREITQSYINSILYANSYRLIKINKGYLLSEARQPEYGMYQDLYLLDNDFRLVKKISLLDNAEIVECGDTIIVAFDQYDEVEDQLFTVILKTS